MSVTQEQQRAQNERILVEVSECMKAFVRLVAVYEDCNQDMRGAIQTLEWLVGVRLAVRRDIEWQTNQEFRATDVSAIDELSPEAIDACVREMIWPTKAEDLRAKVEELKAEIRAGITDWTANAAESLADDPK